MERGSLSVSVPPGIPNWRVLVCHKTLLEGWVPYFALHGLVGVDPRQGYHHKTSSTDKAVVMIPWLKFPLALS